MGDQQDYGMRVYDPRVGRFLSFDPLSKEYTEFSPFHFAGNNPIRNLDRDGGEPLDYSWKWQYKRFSVDGGNMIYSRNVMDRKLGVIDVEAVYDKVTSKTWFIHQDDNGRNYYWKHNPGADQTVRRVDNGRWVSFETQEAIQSRLGAESGEQLQMAVFLITTQIVSSFTGLNPLYVIDPLTPRHDALSNRTTLGETSEQHDLVEKSIVKDGHLPGSSGAFLGEKRLPEEVMRQMSNQYNVEFAQVYFEGTGENGGGGYYMLYSGTLNTVNIPSGKDSYLINHTHPGGNTQPSVYDVDYLKKQQETGSKQKSSVILPKDKPAERFNTTTETIKKE